MARRFSTPLARVALLALSLVLALLAAEVALRLVGFDYSPLTIRTRSEVEEELPHSSGDSRTVHLFQDEHFTYDPRLIWRPRPGESVFNSQGYRGPELEVPKPAGEVRVIAFGDSNTLGWAQEHGANWPDYLGRLLAETDPRIVTVNAGVWGYSQLQGNERLREALGFEPDLVLFNFGSNDAHPVYLSDEDYRAALLGSSIPGLSRLKVTQVVMSFWDRVAQPRWLEASDGSRELVKRVPVEQYRELLREVADLGAERGFDSVFLTRPYIGFSLRPRTWRYWAPEYTRATLDVAAELRLPSVDLRGEFGQRRDLFADESHFTRLGHQIAAKRIYDEIAPVLVERGVVEAAALLPPGERFRDRLTIDLGTPGAAEYLVSGFSAGREAKGRSAARSRGGASTVEVALSPRESAAYVLSVEAMPVVRKKVVEVAASVNGSPVGSRSVTDAWASYEFVLPPGALREGLNRVEFSYRESEPPAGERAPPAEATPPAIVYDRLTLRPRNGAPPEATGP